MNLQLSLKKQWFEMTNAGIKTEDYREITPYWCNRLLLYNGSNYSQEMYKRLLDKWGKDFLKKLTENELNQDTFKIFKTNTLTLGYPKSNDTERILKLEHKGIKIRTGNPEWGAEPNKLYFVIMHGDVIIEDDFEIFMKWKESKLGGMIVTENYQLGLMQEYADFYHKEKLKSIRK